MALAKSSTSGRRRAHLGDRRRTKWKTHRPHRCYSNPPQTRRFFEKRFFSSRFGRGSFLSRERYHCRSHVSDQQRSVREGWRLRIRASKRTSVFAHAQDRSDQALHYVFVPEGAGLAQATSSEIPARI